MNTNLIVETIRSLGYEPQGVEDYGAWNDLLSHPDIKDYLTSCMTEDGLDASGVGILGLSRLPDEHAGDVSPGGKIRRFGYLTIAMSIGGNAVLLSSNDGKVYWAYHSSFSDDVEISYEDRDNGGWIYLPWTPENVQRALVPLSNSIETFLLELFAGKLEARLDELDS